MRILLVGEGNLTFAYALIKKLSKSKCFGRFHAPSSDVGDAPSVSEVTPEKPIVTVVVTTFDSKAELMEKYPETIPIFHYFSEKTRIRIVYKDCVDATRITESLTQGDNHDLWFDSGGEKKMVASPMFDMIFFNNPHTGKEDLLLQHCLLAHFFASARKVLRPTAYGETPSQVVVSLCDEQPTRWGLLQAAARSGFACVAAVPFTTAEFPEFDNKRHQNDAKFPFQQMTHFYFVQVEATGEHVPSRCILSDLQHVVVADRVRQEGTVPAIREMWLALAKHFGTESRRDAGALPLPHQHLKLLKEEVVQQIQREGARWGARPPLCVPLLHPLLCYYHAALTTADDERSTPTTHMAESYSPLLPIHHLSALLLLQTDLLAQHEAPGRTQTTSSSLPAASPPPHLDPVLLGRPLTAKEQAKLRRYEVKFGSGSTAGKPDAADNTPTTTYALPFLTDPATFVDSLEQRAPNHSAPCYCSACGMEFETEDRFAQHMYNLAPLEDRFVCSVCPERKPFKSERALRQHEARVHGNVPQ